MARAQSYSQQLPALDLSIERNTEAVPQDDRYYVLHAGSVKGCFRSLAPAQAQWKEIVAESGWKPPPPPELSSAERKARDKVMRERYEKAEHWNRVRGRR